MISFRKGRARMIVLMIFSIAVLLSSSCQESNQNVVDDTGILVSYVDAEGNDLVDSDNSNAISSSQIVLYTLDNGNQERVSNGNLDSPKGYFVFFHEGKEKNILQILSSQFSGPSGDFEVLIKLNELKGDTLKYTMEKNGSVQTISAVWHNDVLKWSKGDGERYVEIMR